MPTKIQPKTVSYGADPELEHPVRAEIHQGKLEAIPVRDIKAQVGAGQRGGEQRRPLH